MKILLGVAGGVAVYKAAELTRELLRRGAEVQVLLTAAAERFVTPLTFASLSGRQVLTSLWQPSESEFGPTGAPFTIEHIRIAQEADALVIAPATADLLARLAHGLANDLLSTVALACPAPLLLAPAMNVVMWQHPATQANLALLRSRGAHIVPPGSGALACGMVGDGRLAEVTTIADAVFAAIAPPRTAQTGGGNSQPRSRARDLTGRTILVTAGGTREPIDPVRFLGNRSSGRMGHALAEAALARGAQVILITAALGLPPLACEQIPVTTAAEMQRAVLAHLPRASVVLMAAAVADYRVATVAPHKLKKQPHLTLELTPNPDILRAIIAARRPGTLVIGFAAETAPLLESLRAEARRKLQEKGVDAIVANDVSTATSGFDVDHNAGILLTPTAEFTLPPGSKRQMADRILDHLPTISIDPESNVAIV